MNSLRCALKNSLLLPNQYRLKQLQYVMAAWNIRRCSSCICREFHRTNFPLLSSSKVLSTRLVDNEQKNGCYQQRRFFSINPNVWFTWWSQTQLVLSCQSASQYIHDISHLPWWVTIVVVTSILRLAITFPLSIYQQVILAKFQNLQPEIAKVAADLQNETTAAVKMFNWNKSHAQYMHKRSLKKQITKLLIRDNCHPFKSTIVVWVQLPMWISISCALRNMTSMLPAGDPSAQIAFLELSTGGALWFPNLIMPDASFILPVMFGVLNLLIVEVHALKGVKTRSRFRTGVTYLMRGVSIVMIPIAASVPSCMALYWTTSSALGLMQNVMLSYPSVRRKLNIPVMSEEPSPVQDLLEKIKGKIGS